MNERFIGIEISCACGCGEKLINRDNRERPRKYINGHNGQGEHLSQKIKDKISKTKKGVPALNRRKQINEEKLIDLYVNKKVNMIKCGIIFNCSNTHIGRKLIDLNIPIRKSETKFKKGQKPNGGFKTRFKNGKDHPLWKGGVSLLYDKIKQTCEYKLWRDTIYKRDYWHCQLCGKHCEKENIIAHHKKSFSDYPELRFDVNNGITLCRNCHAKIHNYNGSFISKGELALCL